MADKDTVEKAVAEIAEDYGLEDYIILDKEPDGRLSAITRKIFGDVTKQSAAKQVAIGGATGWVSGYLVNSVGKTAAVAVGSSVLIIQVAQHKGYINVNWTKVKKAVTKARAQAEREFKKNQQGYFDSAKRFYNDNYFLASGFAGGFLFGFFF